jgi:hypothetical protein
MKESDQDAGYYWLSYDMAQDKRLTLKDVILYGVMLGQCTKELVCSVSSSDISALTNGRVTKRTFFHCLNRLEKCGYIERIRTAGRANTYKLTIAPDEFFS